jgi:hypothetical protein
MQEQMLDSSIPQIEMNPAEQARFRPEGQVFDS